MRPLPLVRSQGDVVLVATEYEDGWSRGMKLETKEVCASRVLVGMTTLNSECSEVWFTCGTWSSTYHQLMALRVLCTGVCCVPSSRAGWLLPV